MQASGHILVYHRVAVPAADPYAICITPERFGEHLSLLVDGYRPMSLTELLRGLDAGDLPPRAVTLTFDDGYADNALTALPLLREVDVPATVFVATATLGTEVEFWWDRLQAVFLTPGLLPQRVALRTGMRPFRADLADDCAYSEDDAQRHAGWVARSEPPPTQRHAAFIRLFRRIQRLDGPAAAAVLESLEAWAGRSASKRGTRRCLSLEDLAAMKDSGLIDIGAHTVRHPRLSKLRRGTRAEEITASRDRLAEIVGPVRHFAYPFGDDAGSVALVRGAGFASACTTRPGAVTSASDRYRLPRMYVGNWPSAELAARLAEASAGR